MKNIRIVLWAILGMVIVLSVATREKKATGVFAPSATVEQGAALAGDANRLEIKSFAAVEEDSSETNTFAPDNYVYRPGLATWYFELDSVSGNATTTIYTQVTGDIDYTNATWLNVDTITFTSASSDTRVSVDMTKAIWTRVVSSSATASGTNSLDITYVFKGNEGSITGQ